MIIKSKGRKDTNFKQLVEYVHRSDTAQEQDPSMNFTFLHNIECKAEDLKGIVKAFLQNNDYRIKRSNGVAMHHDTLAFSEHDTAAIIKNPFILWDMAIKYIELRCPNSLAFARPHFDKKHWHLHVVHSGNQMNSKQASRVSKKEFAAIKEEMYEYRREKYPELVHSYLPENHRQRQSKEQTHDEYQMEQRGQRNPKEQLKEHLHNLIGKGSREQFLDYLQEQEAEIYERNGKVTGIKIGKRKYRFKTLLKDKPELLEQLTPLLTKSKTEQRIEQLEELSQQQQVRKQQIQQKEKEKEQKQELSSNTGLLREREYAPENNTYYE